MLPKGFYLKVGVCLLLSNIYYPVVQCQEESSTLDSTSFTETTGSFERTDQTNQPTPRADETTSEQSNSTITDPGTPDETTTNRIETLSTEGSQESSPITTSTAEGSTISQLVTSTIASNLDQSTNTVPDQIERTTSGPSLIPSSSTQNIDTQPKEEPASTTTVSEDTNEKSETAEGSTTLDSTSSTVTITNQPTSEVNGTTSKPSSTPVMKPRNDQTSTTLDDSTSTNDPLTSTDETTERSTTGRSNSSEGSSTAQATSTETSSSTATNTDQEPLTTSEGIRAIVSRSDNEPGSRIYPNARNLTVDTTVPHDYSEEIQALRNQVGVPCSVGSFNLGGVCYQIHHEPVTFKEAFAICHNKHGQIASSNHHLTWLALFESANSTEKFWTGFQIDEFQQVYNVKGQKIRRSSEGAMLFQMNSSLSTFNGQKDQLNPIIFRNKSFELGDLQETAGVICQQTELICRSNFTLVDKTCMKIVTEESASAAASSCSNQTHGYGSILLNSNLAQLRLISEVLDESQSIITAMIEEQQGLCSTPSQLYEGKCVKISESVGKPDDNVCETSSSNNAWHESYARYVAMRDQLPEVFVWVKPKTDQEGCKAIRISVGSENETESKMVEFDQKACNSQTFQVICSTPIQHESNDQEISFQDQKSICTHAPHFGDLSCDFESPLWNEGYCLWSAGPSVLLWKAEPASEGLVPTENHFVRAQGPGTMVLDLGSIFECSRVRSNAFGMRLRSEGLTQAALRFEKVFWNRISDGMIKSYDLGLESRSEWTYLAINLTGDSLCDLSPDSLFQVSITFGITEEGFVELDDLGPCHFYDFYDPATKTCVFRSTKTGPKDEGFCSDVRRMSRVSPMNPNDGSTLMIKNLFPNESRWDHIEIANSFGDRMFHADGAKTSDSISFSDSKSDLCGIYKVENGSEVHEAVNCDSTEIHSYCQYSSILQSTDRLLGCWTDLNNNTESSPVVEDPFMSIQMCSTICKGQGSSIGLVQGWRCMCSNGTMANFQKLTENHCTNPCPGEPSQTCGGLDQRQNKPSFTAININAQGFARPDSCMDHYKLGLLPIRGCHKVVNSHNQKLDCCQSKLGIKACADGFIGLFESCFKVISGADLQPKSVLDINNHCQNKGAQLVQEMNFGHLISLFDIFGFHPSFRPTNKDQGLSFPTGAFIDFFTDKLTGNGLRSVGHPRNQTCQRPRPICQSEFSEMNGSMSGSCYELFFNGSIEIQIHRTSCFDLTERRAFVCQAAEAPIYKIAKINETSPFPEFVDAIYDHPMMSQTACSAFCFGKGAKTVILADNSCYCLKDDVEQLELITSPDFKPKLLPCPGNPIQFCGFEEADKWTLVMDNRDGAALNLGFKSCAELKAANVFMDAKFKLNGKIEHCSNWKGPCKSEEYLYGKQCIMFPTLVKKFEDAEKACSSGQEMLQDPSLGFWAESMGLGSKGAYWGGKNDSSCFLSDGSLEDCETKKKFVCARPICPKPQNLIAGLCVTTEGAEESCQPGTGSDQLPGIAVDHMKALKIIATKSSSTPSGPICFKELPCSIGSHMLPDGQSCLIAVPKPSTSMNPQEVCHANGAELPIPLTSADRTQLAESVRNILVKKDDGLNLTDFKIEIGLRGSVYHPFSVVPDGTYATEGLNATIPIYPGFAYQFYIKNPDSFVSIVQKAREPIDQDFYICVQQMSKQAMCFTKGSLESDLQHSVTMHHISAYDCSVYCLNHDMKYGSIMSQGTEETSTTCACLAANVSLAEKEVATTCTAECGQQTCGQEDSMAIYSTDDLDLVYDTCEMAVISSPILRDMSPILLKSPKTGKATKVNCPFKSKEVCQQPLLATLDLNFDSLYLNGEKQTSAATYLSQFYSEIGFVSSKNLTLKVFFNTRKTLRHLTTAWEILGMRYGDSEEDISNEVVQEDGSQWTFEPNQNGLTEQIPLPKTIMANAIEIDLHRRNVSQFNPFFEIRGCDFAQPESSNLNSEENSEETQNERKKRDTGNNGIEVKLGGRLYSFKKMDSGSKTLEAAQSLCGDAKLVTINSRAKALEVANALQNDTDNLGSYVIGLKKMNKIWTHSNGQALSDYYNWANGFNQSILNENEEPQVDKECAKVLTDQLSNESNPLPWFATDCQSLEVEGALCEMPDPNTQFPELEKLECLLKDNKDSWYMISNTTTNATECMSACTTDVTLWQWSIFESDGCYCLKFIEDGFLPESQCSKPGNPIPVATAFRLWKLGCSPLKDLGHKNLLLTYHHQYFLNGTTAEYGCKAGYQLETELTSNNLTFTCQENFEWNLDPNKTLPSCVPITCPPPMEPTFAKGWNISHRLHYGKNQSLITTSFQTFCPEGLMFDNNETQFEAKCTGQDSWTLTSSLGCATPENMTTSNMTRYKCPSLPWTNLDCSVPNCTQDIWDELNVTTAEAEVLDKFSVAKTPGSSGVIRCVNSSATFRSVTNSSKPLGNITATCMYDSNATSKWSFFDEGVKRTSLPTCDLYCTSEPPSPGIHMTRDWNGNRWTDVNVTYKCDEGLAFDHKDANSSDALIVAKCGPNPNGPANQWMLSFDGNPLTTLPKCVVKCDKDPPLDAALFIQSWDKNKTVGAKAQYTCVGPDENSFFSGIYYPIIEMICKQYPGETKGEWVWNNIGTDRSELPECKPSSSCQPLQDFFDDKITFDPNLDFIVRKRESFINVEGYNAGLKSGPGAKIKAKCQFEPEWLVDSKDVAYAEVELQCQDFGNNTAQWIWLDPKSNEERMDPFDCKARCTTEAPAKAGFLKGRSEKWVGSKTIYSCEDPTMLIKKNATHGFETVAVECVSTSRFQPWWINLEKLTECQPNLVPTSDDENVIVTLPTNNPALGPVEYPHTTRYHWPNFDLNATDPNPEDFEVVSGPNLFREAVELKQGHDKCLIDKEFAAEDDTCIRNPVNCEDGFSFSLFFKPNYDLEPHQFFNASKTFFQEYIVSTGGDKGSPGFGIYIQGGDIGAVVSTGVQVWKVQVKGGAPDNKTWTNLAIKWEPPLFNTEDELEELLTVKKKKFHELGGLQLYRNLELIGQTFHPDEDVEESGGEQFDQPEIMIGCHRTPQDDTPRKFSHGSYDELAFWARALNATEEVFFLGGYKDVFEDVGTDDLLKILNFIDYADVNQADTAINIMDSIVNGEEEEEEEFRNIYPETTPTPSESTEDENGTTSTVSSSTTTTTTEAPKKDSTKDVKNLMKIAKKLTSTDSLNYYITKREFDVRMKAVAPLGEFMGVKGKYAEGWTALKKDKNEAGPFETLTNLKNYVKYNVERYTVVPPDSRLRETRNVVSTNNFVMEAFKMTSTNFGKLGSVHNGGYFQFPNWNSPEWAKAKASFGYTQGQDRPTESVDISSELFTEECKKNDVNFVGMISDTFPDHGRKNPSFIYANHIELDSRVITLDITANKLDTDPDSPTFNKFGERCEIDPKLAVKDPFILKFAIKSKRNHDFGRKLTSYYDSFDDKRVNNRHCVIWNEDIGPYGAWDTRGVTLVKADDAQATCYATKLGIYAIVAEIEDVPYAEDDETWLNIVKYIGYAISIILLLIFIGVILSSTYLWEMFHLIAVNMAFSLLFGHIFMLISELDAVRDDRDACSAIGLLILFFYSALSVFITMECYAMFKAIISGIIGGHTRTYLCFGYGVPLLHIGVSIFIHLQEMGTDPRCMVGWANEVKEAFYIPVAIFGILSVFLVLVMVCNINTPAMRKESMVEELGSLAKGLGVFVLLYALTWSWFPFAYMRFPTQEFPDFYPAFQVMNSFMGMFFFVFIGLMSNRFRTALTGGILMRRKALLVDESADDNYVEQVNEDSITTMDDIEPEDDEDEEDVEAAPRSRPESGKSVIEEQSENPDPDLEDEDVVSDDPVEDNTSPDPNPNEAEKD